MRTAAEKKRLFWVLVAIAFFFANLILMTVLVFDRVIGGKGTATQPGMQAATQPATQGQAATQR